MPLSDKETSDRVLRLSKQLVEAKDLAAAKIIGAELRQAIHDQIDALRLKLSSSLYIDPTPPKD